MGHSSPRVLLGAYRHFLFDPAAFAAVRERFVWLGRTERAHAVFSWIMLASLLVFLASVPVALLRAPVAAGALVVAWLLHPLLHTTYAPWEETRMHRLMCQAIVPLTMLLLCEAAVIVVSQQQRPFLTAALAATVVIALAVPLRWVIGWPLFLARLRLMTEYARDDAEARPAHMSEAELRDMHAGLEEMFAQRIRRRGWLLRWLIRDEELPGSLRSSP